MCGIWFCLGDFCVASYEKYIHKVKARGPEETKILSVENVGTMGFNRLAINGLNDESNQPIVYNDIVLICNGEIYNYQELIGELQAQCVELLHVVVKIVLFLGDVLHLASQLAHRANDRCDVVQAARLRIQKRKGVSKIADDFGIRSNTGPNPE